VIVLVQVFPKPAYQNTAILACALYDIPRCIDGEINRPGSKGINRPSLRINGIMSGPIAVVPVLCFSQPFLPCGLRGYVGNVNVVGLDALVIRDSQAIGRIVNHNFDMKIIRPGPASPVEKKVIVGFYAVVSQKMHQALNHFDRCAFARCNQVFFPVVHACTDGRPRLPIDPESNRLSCWGLFHVCCLTNNMLPLRLVLSWTTQSVRIGRRQTVN